MDNNSFENTNNNINENKPSKLFEYKELVNKIIEKVSLLEQDWKMFENEENTFPSNENGIQVIEFLTSDQIADGPFIRNFYYDLEDFMEKENSEGNYSKVKKFVSFNHSLRMSQDIIWKLRDEKSILLEYMKNIEDFGDNPSANNKEILYVSNFYLLMKNLNSFLKEMSAIFNSETNK